MATADSRGTSPPSSSAGSFTSGDVTHYETGEEHTILHGEHIRAFLCTWEKSESRSGEYVRSVYATDLFGTWNKFDGELPNNEQCNAILGVWQIIVVNTKDRKVSHYKLDKKSCSVSLNRGWPSSRLKIERKDASTISVGPRSFFVCGGNNEDGKVEKYAELHDQENFSWSKQNVASLKPILAKWARRQWIIAIANIDAADGESIPVEVCDVTKADLKWEILCWFPGSVRSVARAASVVYEGKLYIVGGDLDAMWAWDLSREEWEELPSPPHPHAVGCLGFGKRNGERCLVFAGIADGQGHLQVYDVDAKRWTTVEGTWTRGNGGRNGRVEALHVNSENYCQDLANIQGAMDMMAS